jgi:hypothetical protein
MKVLCICAKITEICQYNEICQVLYLGVDVFIEAGDQLDAHGVKDGLPAVQLMGFSSAHHASAG